MHTVTPAAPAKLTVPLQGELPSNPHVRQWIADCRKMCQPDRVRVLDGSAAEYDDLLQQAVNEGVLIRLNATKLPGCYLHRSHPTDVARTEHCTYICCRSQNLAGPTNNWMPPKEAYARLTGLFTSCMRGRTMYVVPFVMGPAGSPLARVGVEITDSIYVAISMGIMTRMGKGAWQQLGDSPEFTLSQQALGNLNPDLRYICHFP
jgi:phosphoenolpyruvate carboxykinase (GTP)